LPFLRRECGRGQIQCRAHDSGNAAGAF
jgi:hypothetical protein